MSFVRGSHVWPTTANLVTAIGATSVLNVALRFVRVHYNVDATLMRCRHRHHARAFETRFARSLRRFSKYTISLVPASGLKTLYDSSPSNTASEAKCSSPVPPIIILPSLSTQA